MKNCNISQYRRSDIHGTFVHGRRPKKFYMSICAVYLSRKIDMLYLGVAFVVGYFSHLYLSDALTPSGVPISFIPTLFKKLKIHHKLKDRPFYKKAMRFLSKRISFRLIQTGSTWEKIYVFALIVICIIEYSLIKPYAFF